MELRTERLVLHEYTLEDFDTVHAFASDPRIARYVDWGPNTEDDTRSFLHTCMAFQNAAPRTNISLAITPTSTLTGTLAITEPGGVPVGSVRLTVDEDHHGHLGYIIDARHRGEGYAICGTKNLASA